MPDHAAVHTDSCRRQFLQALLSSAVVGVAIQTGIELATQEMGFHEMDQASA